MKASKAVAKKDVWWWKGESWMLIMHVLGKTPAVCGCLLANISVMQNSYWLLNIFQNWLWVSISQQGSRCWKLEKGFSAFATQVLLLPRVKIHLVVKAHGISYTSGNMVERICFGFRLVSNIYPPTWQYWVSRQSRMNFPMQVQHNFSSVTMINSSVAWLLYMHWPDSPDICIVASPFEGLAMLWCCHACYLSYRRICVMSDLVWVQWPKISCLV